LPFFPRLKSPFASGATTPTAISYQIRMEEKEITGGERICCEVWTCTDAASKMYIVCRAGLNGRARGTSSHRRAPG
jgi:hypothetical protein